MLMAQMGTDVYLASLPAISISLDSAITTVQYTFSIFLAGFAVSQLFTALFPIDMGESHVSYLG